MKPFLKWCGGKSKISSQILDLFPDQIENYWEPFLGGGSIALAWLQDPRSRGATTKLLDKGEELINCWNMVKSCPREVARCIAEEKPATGWSEEYYYQLRNRDRINALGDQVQRAARFILLNKLCFRGVCRYNQKAQFNSPWGDYKNPLIPGEKILSECSSLISFANISFADFKEPLSMALPGDFVYLDPPYVPLRKNGFTQYVGSWSIEDQQDLLKMLTILNDRGVKWLLSGHDEPFYRFIYAEYDFTEILVSRSISVSGDRAKAKELLIKNY